MADLLLVDGDAAARAVHARLLEYAGHVVAAAASGAEALDLLRASGRRFDAMVIDLALPDTDGFALVAAARRIVPSLPALAIAEGGDRIGQDLAQLAAHLGADGVLRKPTRPAILLAAVTRLLAPCEPV
jgi:CheY-like chemotaxis protein